jgi:peptide/nickel transport system substrate-binding protein
VATIATRGHWFRRVATILALGLVAAACGGGGGDDGGGGGGGATGEDPGTPTPGGKVTYGLEAETIDGWCLPEGELAISGIVVANTIFDTLTRPNAEGEIEPWLAESVEPNDDFTQWTITLPEGVTFHDGSELTAGVVKNNIDAWRGQYPGRSSTLLLVVFQPIASVEVVDPLTVQVNLNQSWAAFDAYLWSSGRTGIIAQAQLDDAQTCDRNLIGTGPFQFVDWTPNQNFVAEKNPDYWATDAEGNQLPYLDEIEFRPIVESSQRFNALQSGEINAMHTSNPQEIVEVRDLTETGELNSYETEEFGETSYLMLNSSVPPFDNITARQAVAYALDFEEFNAIIGEGIYTQATGPFAPGNVGNLEPDDFPDFPTHDPDRARELVADYEAQTGQALSFTYTAQQDETALAIAQFVKEKVEDVGISMDITAVDQSTVIDTAIQGNYEGINFRNHPGGPPDLQYNWWYTGSPINFGRIDDPEIDALLDQGRATTDPDELAQIYEDINLRFGEQLWNLWSYYTVWIVGTATDVHGVPGEGPTSAEPFPGIAVGHPVAYMWVEQ